MQFIFVQILKLPIFSSFGVLGELGLVKTSLLFALMMMMIGYLLVKITNENVKKSAPYVSI
jgi:hypothetical protein